MKKITDERFISFAKSILLENMLMRENDILELTTIHDKLIYDGVCCHYILTIKNTRQKFFLRTIKDNDNTVQMLNKINNCIEPSQNLIIPCLLSKPYSYKSNFYILMTYVEGQNLENLKYKLSDEEYILIAQKLNYILKKIHSVKSDTFIESNGEQYVNFELAFLNKIIARIPNLAIKDFLSDAEIINFYEYAKNVLVDNQQAPNPTLIHMDIKPGNLIYNRKTQALALVDFELSRFGAIEYEWTHLIVKSFLPYGKKFKDFILHYLLKENFTSFDVAIKTPKLKLFLLYQLLCNFDYYTKCKSVCPKDVKRAIKIILKSIEQEIKND